MAPTPLRVGGVIFGVFIMQSKVTPISKVPEPPSSPGQWALQQVIEALSRPLPQRMLKQRKQGGQVIDYIPWHTVNKILDKYAPGWRWQIVKMELSSDRIFIVGRLTIPCSDGVFYREATGTEELKETTRGGETRELAWGDPTSNSESMSFRRCAARFGLGLYLYEKK